MDSDLISNLPSEAVEFAGPQGTRIPALAKDEVRRLNRLVLETFLAGEPQLCKHRPAFLFDSFVAFWLDHLANVKVDYVGTDISDWKNACEQSHSLAPTGGLTDTERNIRESGVGRRRSERSKQQDQLGDLRENVSTVTSSRRGAWHLMSTGFHQLAPLVVQAGLLHRYEIMAVENPEAHLHPSLQIKIAEFLIQQANAGKVMLIETHSDLIVRRILRAIRQEDIKQEAVQINFTRLDKAPVGYTYKHASISPLQINDRGQIANWPPEFMDDDLKEADRWLAAVERQRSLNDEE